ncbi:hypothetical protein O3P69_002295 [Scylla paramamosain]|uniref:Uncharacterized protein n=1 Tax=Scylla paramamosain TaxID=85552 RepID=A0AAW0V6P0_SCYPA
MGGVWERQIRTVKKVLLAVVGTQTLDDERLATFFCAVEEIVNRRPITPGSDDPRDLEALTSLHLLRMNAEPATIDNDILITETYKRRWKHAQFLADQFWKRWPDSPLEEEAASEEEVRQQPFPGSLGGLEWRGQRLDPSKHTSLAALNEALEALQGPRRHKGSPLKLFSNPISWREVQIWLTPRRKKIRVTDAGAFSEQCAYIFGELRDLSVSRQNGWMLLRCIDPVHRAGSGQAGAHRAASWSSCFDDYDVSWCMAGSEERHWFF